eukprot:6466731-Amphidinium_carterae.1
MIRKNQLGGRLRDNALLGSGFSPNSPTRSASVAAGFIASGSARASHSVTRVADEVFSQMNVHTSTAPTSALARIHVPMTWTQSLTIFEEARSSAVSLFSVFGCSSSCCFFARF